METPFRENGRLEELSHLRKKVGSLEVILQKMNLERELIPVMGINGFDHETKVKARSKRRNLQTASQLCTKQVGTGEINQIIESLLKVKYPKNNQNIFNRNLRRKEMFLVSTRVNPHRNRIPKARVHLAP